MFIINQLLYILKSKHDHFLFIDLDLYKTWKYLIRFLVFINKNYIPCTIYKRNFKFHKNIVVIGLKWNGKNVKRRTTGFAKDFLDENKSARCLYCNQKLTKTNITTDHIIPLSKGGNNCQVNLVTCCLKCNNERGNMDFYRYLKLKNPKKDLFL